MDIKLIKAAIEQKAQQNHVYQTTGTTAIKEPAVNETIISLPTGEPTKAETLPGYNKEYIQFREFLVTVLTVAASCVEYGVVEVNLEESANFMHVVFAIR